MASIYSCHSPVCSLKGKLRQKRLKYWPAARASREGHDSSLSSFALDTRRATLREGQSLTASPLTPSFLARFPWARARKASAACLSLPHPCRVSVSMTLTNSLPPVFFTGKQEGRKEGRKKRKAFQSLWLSAGALLSSFLLIPPSPAISPIPEWRNLEHLYL